MMLLVTRFLVDIFIQTSDICGKSLSCPKIFVTVQPSLLNTDKFLKFSHQYTAHSTKTFAIKLPLRISPLQISRIACASERICVNWSIFSKDMDKSFVPCFLDSRRTYQLPKSRNCWPEWRLWIWRRQKRSFETSFCVVCSPPPA